jgi:hypothetical protein
VAERHRVQLAHGYTLGPDGLRIFSYDLIKQCYRAKRVILRAVRRHNDEAGRIRDRLKV